MTVVKLMGGLGNQMFQYAAARRLAARHKTVLKLDLSFLEGDQSGITPRKFELGRLNICAERASRPEVERLLGQGGGLLATAATRMLRLAGLKERISFYREKQFNFDPAVLALPDPCYLEGYWQSEKYFADIRDLLLEEFSLRDPLSGANLQLAETIQESDAISLHVRRGDYVSDPGAAAFHGTCSPDYYREAAARLASGLAAPRFFLFTDDPAWVKQHLKLPFPTTLVEHNGPDQGHEDLRLMSLCKRHVVANSSLSWWGAWLSVSPGKMVTAPVRWFNDPAVNTCDLLPSGWLTL